jgi:hypothetical protein
LPAPTNVVQVSPKDLIALLPLYVKGKRPVHIWGSPGIGKSDIVRQVAATLGYKVVDVRGALLDPVDLRGLPHINGGGKVHWATPEFLPTEADGKVLMFFDEMNRATSMVQNAILQLILDRQLGEYHLPDAVVCIAAGNYESDGGGVQKMNAALANRFQHFHLHPNVPDWMNWALEHGIAPEIVGFLRLRPELLSQFSKTDYAFPTPRSWMFVSEVLGYGFKGDTELAAISGGIGNGPAMEFLGFIKMLRELPDIDELIEDPENAVLPGGNVLYAVVAAMASKAEKSNFENIVKYLNRLSMEWMVMGIRDIAQRHPKLTNEKVFKNWIVEHPEVFS